MQGRSHILASLLVLASAAVQADAPVRGDAEAARGKISMCIGCHGIPGYRTSFPDVYPVPKLGGQHPEYIVCVCCRPTGTVSAAIPPCAASPRA
ncbi:c-type cytochrome [Pseudothauera rhizosphaerae]|uniref:c-type cytochrome n=1 Tax=Pseudothauera rhizosphaerae TaxID=2565932 RepID=UPI001454BC95|nr:hypothetical protein [Pseudothauera rhizosphaerae]